MGVIIYKSSKKKPLFWILINGTVLISLIISSCSRGRPYIKPTAKPKIIEIPAKTTAPTMRPYIIHGEKYYPIPRPHGYVEYGKASWYGKRFHGKNTASGEPYNMYELTAAHRTLPMGTYVRVVNLENHKSTIVRINDRGPFIKGRIIDLSYAAAKRLGIIVPGTANVKIEVLGKEIAMKKEQQKTPIIEYIDVENGEFTVQVGAFINKENALRLAKRLKVIFKYVKITKFVGKNNRILYRVHVSRSRNLKEASENARKLQEIGFEEAFVVRL